MTSVDPVDDQAGVAGELAAEARPEISQEEAYRRMAICLACPELRLRGERNDRRFCRLEAAPPGGEYCEKWAIGHYTAMLLGQCEPCERWATGGPSG
jgi:hypothetical protein